MSLRFALDPLESFDALLLRINREVVRPFKCALMRLGERLVLVFEESLHLHLFPSLAAGFSLIFLLLLGLRVGRRVDGVGAPPSLWATTRED